jgi:MFS family permease
MGVNGLSTSRILRLLATRRAVFFNIVITGRKIMTNNIQDRRVAWLVFALISIAGFGNYYVYDSIGPVADLLQQERSFSSTQIGLLNAIYSLPNIVLLLIGGMLVDRCGAARIMVWTAAICLAGAILTAFSPGFAGMAAGRLLFGIGAETLLMASLVGVVQRFSGLSLAFATGLLIATGRLGSFSADVSPILFAGAYRHGWQPPLIIAALIAGGSFAAAAGYRWLDRREARKRTDTVRPEKPFLLRDVLQFGRAYWLLLILCVLWYSVLAAFRSTFSIMYFQHVRHLDLAAAGTMNSYVYLAALFATPAFGWLCDRIGRYAPLLAVGALLLPTAIAILALTHWSIWAATILIGISYSIASAVMWPLASKLVPPERFGTALGLMWVLQNAGVFGTNLVAGWLNDSAGASAQHPAGYQPMMAFFGAASAIGFGFSVLLWTVAGRRRQEAAMHAAALSHC